MFSNGAVAHTRRFGGFARGARGGAPRRVAGGGVVADTCPLRSGDGGPQNAHVCTWQVREILARTS